MFLPRSLRTMDGDRAKSSSLDVEKEEGPIFAVAQEQGVNASGYRDQLKRQYGLFGLAGIALTVDNAWVR